MLEIAWTYVLILEFKISEQPSILFTISITDH